MRLNWKLQRFAIVFTTIAVIVVLAAIVSYAIRPIEPIVPKSDDRASLAPHRSNVDERVDQEAIVQAGQIELQRIRKPLPIATVTPPAAETVVAPPPFQYDGKLVGTLIDSQPKHSYAIVSTAGSTVKLLGLNEFADAPLNQLQVVAIEANSVKLKHLPTDQILSLEVVQ